MEDYKLLLLIGLTIVLISSAFMSLIVMEGDSVIFWIIIIMLAATMSITVLYITSDEFKTSHDALPDNCQLILTQGQSQLWKCDTGKDSPSSMSDDKEQNK